MELIIKILTHFLSDVAKEVVTVLLSTGILSLIKRKKNHSDSQTDNGSSSSDD